MSEKLRIKAVETAPAIRDEHARLLSGKSTAEIIAFFKQGGQAPPTAHPSPSKTGKAARKNYS